MLNTVTVVYRWSLFIFALAIESSTFHSSVSHFWDSFLPCRRCVGTLWWWADRPLLGSKCRGKLLQLCSRISAEKTLNVKTHYKLEVQSSAAEGSCCMSKHMSGRGVRSISVTLTCQDCEMFSQIQRKPERLLFFRWWQCSAPPYEMSESVSTDPLSRWWGPQRNHRSKR